MCVCERERERDRQTDRQRQRQRDRDRERLTKLSLLHKYEDLGTNVPRVTRSWFKLQNIHVIMTRSERDKHMIRFIYLFIFK